MPLIPYNAFRLRKFAKLCALEARRRGDVYVGTEHLLLALIHNAHGMALVSQWGNPAQVEKGVDDISPPSDAPSIGWRLPTTPSLRRTLLVAVREARRVGSQCVTFEHIWLSMLRMRQGVPAQILTNVGMDVEQVTESVQRRLRT